MKFLFFALDTATSGAIVDLNKRAIEAGHECETLIYTRNRPLEKKIVERYRDENISHFISRAHLPVGTREFFTNKAIRKGARKRDIVRAAMFYIVLRAVRVFNKVRRRKDTGVFGRNGDRMLSHYLTLIADISTAEKIFEDHKIDVLLLSHDYVGHFSSILAKKAHEMGIPVLIVPALFADREKVAVIYKNRPELQIETKMEQRAAQKWPEWVMRTPGGRFILRLEWWRIAALKYLELSPKLPWVHHSCYSDLICLPDERLRAEYIRYGFAPEKLVITGNTAQDAIFKSSANKAAKRGKKPLLAVALPPDQFMGAVMDFRHDDLDAQLTELKEVLLKIQNKYEILLMVHPKEDAVKYDLLKVSGFEFAKRRTVDLLPDADVYLSYAGSSTNNWAYWARIPNIQWDIYNYFGHGNDGLAQDGVIEATNKRELLKALLDLADPDVRESLKANIPVHKPYPASQSYFDRIISQIATKRLL